MAHNKLGTVPGLDAPVEQRVPSTAPTGRLGPTATDAAEVAAALGYDVHVERPGDHRSGTSGPVTSATVCHCVPVLWHLPAAKAPDAPRPWSPYDGPPTIARVKMGCADCGCVIESGVRIVICSDDCCCHDVPASEQATRVRQPSDSGIEPDGIRAELEQARATFHALVQSAGEEELGQQSNGTRWTNQQLLFHIMFGHMLVRSLLILVKCFSRLPLSFSRVLARFLDVLAGPFKLVNYWGSCAGSRLYRDERMDPTAVTAVDAKAADEQLCAWLRAEAAAGRLDWRHIAVDGKTMRGAARPDGTRPHLLSAYDVSAGTVLGQAEVDGKTNEITCFVPLLQAILDGRGAVRGSDGSDGSEEDDGSGHGSAQAAAAAAAAEEEESGDQELVIVTADAMHTQAGHVEAMNALGVAWMRAFAVSWSVPCREMLPGGAGCGTGLNAAD